MREMMETDLAAVKLEARGVVDTNEGPSHRDCAAETLLSSQPDSVTFPARARAEPDQC